MRWLVMYGMLLMIALGVLLVVLGVMSAFDGDYVVALIAVMPTPVVIGVAASILIGEIKDPVL